MFLFLFPDPFSSLTLAYEPRTALAPEKVILAHSTIQAVTTNTTELVPIVFALLLPTAASFPHPHFVFEPVLHSRTPFPVPLILAPVFSLRNPPFPLASTLHVGIHMKPDRSIAPHHVLPSFVLF